MKTNVLELINELNKKNKLERILTFMISLYISALIFNLFFEPKNITYLYNNEDKLTIRILYSSQYSKDFMQHFAESYKLIMHEMIEVEELSDINYTTNSDLKLFVYFKGNFH